MQLIEHMVQHLRERNLLMDEALTKYRDLLVSLTLFTVNVPTEDSTITVAYDQNK